MNKKVKIGWDISHLEFTIEDHYYYSKLKSEIIKIGSTVKELKTLDKIQDYEVVVFNYPEIPFRKKDASLIRSFVKKGGTAVITGYYNNEDGIADSVNTLTHSFGFELRRDRVKDKHNCLGGDELLVVTERIELYNEGVNNVMFPCCATINIFENKINPFIYTMKNTSGNRVIGAVAHHGDGKVILIGTCVFWDNNALSHCSNLRFSLNLLLN